MIYIAPDYTLRILNSHPQYVSLQFHKAFRSIYSLPRFVDFGLHVVYEGDLPEKDEFKFARQPNGHWTPAPQGPLPQGGAYIATGGAPGDALYQTAR